MTDTPHERLIGQIEGRLTAVERRQERLEENIDARLTRIDTRLDQLFEVLNQSKGGYRVTGLIASAITFIITVAAYFGFVYDKV